MGRTSGGKCLLSDDGGSGGCGKGEGHGAGSIGDGDGAVGSWQLAVGKLASWQVGKGYGSPTLPTAHKGKSEGQGAGSIGQGDGRQRTDHLRQGFGD